MGLADLGCVGAETDVGGGKLAVYVRSSVMADRSGLFLEKRPWSHTCPRRF